MHLNVRILQQVLKSVLTLTLFSSLLTGTGCGHNTTTDMTGKLVENHSLEGNIFAIQAGHQIRYKELTDKLHSSRFILIGEKHDNPEHHQIEQQLLNDLQNGTTTRLVLEMLDDSQSDNLSKLQSIDSDKEIQKQLNWNDRSWPWQDYGPLITAALKDKNQLQAGNLSKPLLMQIYQGNSPDRSRFITVGNIPDDIRSTIQQQVYESHCQAIPLDQMGAMTDIQISRDASMAYALHKNLAPEMQAILITGAFHARKDIGVPQHLRQITSEPIISILLAETDDVSTSTEEVIQNYTGIADYIWFTGRSEEKDYCASLRQQSHKKGS